MYVYWENIVHVFNGESGQKVLEATQVYIYFSLINYSYFWLLVKILYLLGWQLSGGG